MASQELMSDTALLRSSAVSVSAVAVSPTSRLGSRMSSISAETVELCLLFGIVVEGLRSLHTRLNRQSSPCGEEMNIPGCKDGWRVQLLWIFVAWPGGVSTRYIFLLDIQRPVIVYMRVDDSRPDVSFSIFLGLNVMVRLKIICLISRHHHKATPLRMLMFLAPRQKLMLHRAFPTRLSDYWLLYRLLANGFGILASMMLCFRAIKRH